MDLSPFDFHLPEELIALRPVEPREAARLLVVHGDGRIQDKHISDLPTLLSPGDVMVFNDTRVIPAALTAIRPARDEIGQDVDVTVNLVEAVRGSLWKALVRPGKRLKAGDLLVFASDFSAAVQNKNEDGEVELAFNCEGDLLIDALERYGAMPLPPYIARRRPADEQDKRDYQTRFAGDDAASVAAPTAGLHFNENLLAEIDSAGIARETVRLHVGMGTFAPLKESHWNEARLHEEWRRIDALTAERLNALRAKGGRLVPVGTTAMRTLESAVSQDGKISAVSGPTDIFLRPGDAVLATDALVTNFHLPRSSLFMLVSALMGTDVMQAAYAHAIRSRYRFYSYGDACLLLP